MKRLVLWGKIHSENRQHDRMQWIRDHRFGFVNTAPQMQVGKRGTDDIKTGIPPKMKAEALERWRKEREDMSIDKLFR